MTKWQQNIETLCTISLANIRIRFQQHFISATGNAEQRWDFEYAVVLLEYNSEVGRESAIWEEKLMSARDSSITNRLRKKAANYFNQQRQSALKFSSKIWHLLVVLQYLRVETERCSWWILLQICDHCFCGTIKTRNRKLSEIQRPLQCFFYANEVPHQSLD